MGAHPRGLAVAGLVAGALAGCGSSGSSGDKTTSTASTAAESPPPPALVGTYTTALKKSDLPPNPPPELTNHAKRWQLRIATTGGPAGGPAFTIINPSPTLGALESPSLSVTGSTVALHREECAANNSTVDSFYTYKLSGKQLTFTTVKNGCADKVAETILTSEPWLKTG